MQHEPNPSFQKIEHLFSQTVEDYLPIVQTISIQSQLLQQLQKDHQRLSKHSQELRSHNKNEKAVDESVQEKSKAEMKAEKELFLQEALSVRQTAYQREFQSKKDQLLEEIFLKYQQISLLREKRENTTNLFSHLSDELFGSRGGRGRPEGSRQSGKQG